MNKQDINSLVSVIIPCYNSETTIKNTLSSLEYQTYKNFEVIIIDDGSSDMTANVINDYIKTSNLKIRYFYQENNGVSGARNKGINNSNGEYILFLDSDDVYHKQTIDLLINLVNQYDTDTVFGCYSRKIEELLDEKNKIYNEKIVYLNSDDLLTRLIYRKDRIGFYTFLYKKDIINKHTLEFDDRLSYGEDINFLWKYIINCKNGIFVYEDIYGYLDNPNSAINNISWKATDALLSLMEVMEYIKDNKINFYKTFKTFTFERVKWSVLKDFAVAGKKDLFFKMIEEYNIKKLQINYKDAGLMIFITQLLFNIKSDLFYCFIRMLVKSNVYYYIKK